MNNNIKTLLPDKTYPSARLHELLANQLKIFKAINPLGRNP